MALARTNLIGASGQPGTAAFVTGSFTPPDNSLIVVAMAGMEVSGSSDPSGDFTMAGGGWTYTSRVVIGTAVSWSLGVRIWTAPVTTGASMTLSGDAAARSMELVGISAVAYTGYDTGTPIGVTGTKIETAAPDGAQTLTLSGNPVSASEVFAAIGFDKESIGTTPGAAFTEIHELQVFASGGMQSEIRTGSTLTSVDWVDTHTGTGSIFKLVAAALEIKALGGGVAEEGPANSPAINRMGLNLAY